MVVDQLAAVIAAAERAIFTKEYPENIELKLRVPILLAMVMALSVSCRDAGVRYSNNHFDKVTLRPGDSFICIQSPCAVYFVMPEGNGNYVIKGSNVYPQSYPAGQTVFLGSYWTGGYSFIAEGSDTPYAYLSVVGGGEDSSDFR